MLKLLGLYTAREVDDIKQKYENSLASYQSKVMELTVRIQLLKIDLKEARKNDYRDEKGRFAKRPKND